MVSRRDFTKMTIGAAVMTGLDSAAATAPEGKPNFVFILADDVNRDTLEIYGSRDCRTPNISRLASEGMIFDNAYCAVAMCAPFRQELYSGRTPWRTGTLANHSKSKPDTKSIVHYLEPLGYRTALLGKTHIGPKTVYPFEYLGDGDRKKDCNDLYLQKSGAFIDSSLKQRSPFCLFIASHDGHSPYTTGDASKYPPGQLTVPPYWLDTPELRKVMSPYFAEITNFDTLVGRIYDCLKKRDLLDNTVLVVCTEQGTGLPFAKWTCFNNGLATGLVVRYPSMAERGSRCAELVCVSDIAPTFVELAGGKTEDIDCDGESVVSLIKGSEKPIHEYVYGAFTNCNIIDNRDRIYPIRCIRDKRYTLIYCPAHEEITSNVTLSEALEIVSSDSDTNTAKTPAGSWAVKRKTDKRAADLVKRLFHRPEYALYDREGDPYEENNLVEDPRHQAVFERMKQRLNARLEELGDSDPVATETSLCRRKGVEHPTSNIQRPTSR